MYIDNEVVTKFYIILFIYFKKETKVEIKLNNTIFDKIRYGHYYDRKKWIIITREVGRGEYHDFSFTRRRPFDS